MFYDNAGGLVRVLVVGTLAYVWLILLLRLTGKRTLAQLDAFDFIVTVALGSTLATVILSNSVALAEGVVALGLLAVLQLVIAWVTTRRTAIRHVVTARPALLLRDGQLLPAAMTRERITAESVRQAVRSSGAGGLELVAAVVLETNGKVSVITRDQLGSGSALTDVRGAGERSGDRPSPLSATT